MATLPSHLNVRSDTFVANSEWMQQALAEVRTLEQKVRQASAAKRARFDKRGQLLPRQRVDRLLDRGAPFLELATLAGLRLHDDDGDKSVMGGGFIAGVGFVSGRRCVLLANDSAIKGGTVTPMGLKKTLRMQQIAKEHKLPVVSLLESGGANLRYQGEMFVAGGRAFANQARMSAAGIPQIAVVHGSATAGGAYLPGLSDYVILVRNHSKIFLAGPPLVKAAMGEDTDDEALGGAELHAKVTGLGEYLAEDDRHAIAIARELLAMLKWDNATVPHTEVTPPRYAPDELIGVVPQNPRQPYDVREVIARLVDGSNFLEFKTNYGSDTVCGHAHIYGHAVGIIGNNGPIQPHGSTKAAQFMQLCDQTGCALLFLQNTTGYMVGSAAERAGAIKHGSKMIQAVANARVPKLTVVLGGSFGAGNYGMCGRGFDPNFIFSWPSARIGVMGGAQAAKVMEIITLAKFARRGQQVDPELVRAMLAPLQKQLDDESHVLFGSARLWDDGIIDPRDTREVLKQCLDTIAEAQRRQLRPNTFGVARL